MPPIVGVTQCACPYHDRFFLLVPLRLRNSRLAARILFFVRSESVRPLSARDIFLRVSRSCLLPFLTGVPLLSTV